MSIHTDPTVRHDILLAYDVHDSNPNGDPDDLNAPRIDIETDHGITTDVSLKRRIRDTLPHAAAAHDLDPNRYKIFVTAGIALNDQLQDAYTATDTPLDDEKTAKKRTLTRDVDAARAWLLNRYIDIRLFGAVMSTGRTSGLGKLRGPIQIGFSRTVDPVLRQEHTITRVTQTTREDIDKGQTTEMGSKWTIPYGLYLTRIHYSALRGASMGITADDLTLFYNALHMMWDHTASAARANITTRGLWIYTHNNAYGNAPANTLLSRTQITRIDTTTPPRSIDDYTITTPTTPLPDGVTLTTSEPQA